MIPQLLYRLLLWCHPPSFQRRFADEMLWIFQETADSHGSARLLADGFVSLLRQWFLRSGLVWKVPLAAVGGLLAPLFGLGLLPVLTVASSNVRIHSLQSLMILTALSSMLVITLTLILSVSWFRFFQKRRA
jgi:hypothetical protein